MSAGASQTGSSPVASGRPRRRVSFWLFWFWLVVLLALLLNYLRFDLSAYAMLMRFADGQASGPLLRLETHDVTAEDMQVAGLNGTFPARLYVPVGVAHPRGMVAVHGIHHLGMDEPRLVAFARAIAATGLAVLTPQVDSLADYHVDAASIATIGKSAAWLDARLGQGPVTVTGISFAGGLSLLAATNPSYASHMRALVLMGAYDDLSRVSRFLATGQQELPDGRVEPHPAHDYGASVFVYSHLGQFFPAAELPTAHEALRDWLWEEPEKAKPVMEKLSPQARATMDALLSRRIDEVRPEILNAIQLDKAELSAISPSGNLARLDVPVYILHGSADNIIPPAESLWLAKDVPQSEVRDVLITGAFSHVDPAKHPPLLEELQLVQFVGDVLRAAN